MWNSAVSYHLYRAFISGFQHLGGDFLGTITAVLDEIQNNLFEKASKFKDAHTKVIDGKEAFYAFFTPQSEEKSEIHGGFALSPWCGAEACEEKIKEDLSVTIRCIPLHTESEKGKCICCGSPAGQRVVFAKAY